MKKKNSDSVPAMLTPREAILNRNAAELLGRDTIKRLNDHGNMLSRRGVDLASRNLPSDPTPGPSTENMLGYQYGTSMVQDDDRADLLRDTDATFYGGGNAPAPSPTPTPARRYAYGTSSVDDFGSPFLKKNRFGSGSPSYLGNNQTNATSRILPQSITQDMADAAYISKGGGYLAPRYDQFTGRVNAKPMSAVGLRGNPGNQNVSGSRYVGAGGIDLGPQYGGQGDLSPKPRGAVGLQGSPFTQPVQNAISRIGAPMTHTEMASDIARRNLTASGSSLGTPQPQASPIQDDPNKPSNISSSSYQAYLDQSGTTTHFLPPGFTATTGSTGAPNSSPNDIHFLPPGFTSVQGQTNPVTKQLQQPDEGYGSAYGY